MHLNPRYSLIAIALVTFCTCSNAQCPALSKDAPVRITEYLAKRLISGQQATPTILSIDRVPNTCYRRLNLAIPGVTHQVVMYLSPDERFLTSALYDLASDPEKEVTRISICRSNTIPGQKQPLCTQPALVSSQHQTSGMFQTFCSLTRMRSPLQTCSIRCRLNFHLPSTKTGF